jgi:molybdopterin/thiamine biosynthesis adenylyltransferase/molybdopterin converting factor small subunit
VKQVVIVGAGGLGSPLLLALGLAGGAHLVVVDDDVVEIANLHRQILFGEADVGRPKAVAAREAMAARGVHISARQARWDAASAPGLASGADILVDCTDSPDAKFGTSDLAMATGRPAVIASAIRDEGQVFASVPGSGRACYRCFFESPPDDADVCAYAGVLGPRCGLVAAQAARVVLDLIAGRDPGGALFLPDRVLSPLPRPGCPACIASPSQGARMPIVRIPTPLRKLTLGKEEVTAAGATVGALIEDLERQFPGLKDRLCDAEGQVRRFVNIFQNDEDIRYLKQLETPIKDSDEISIIPAIAGGR